MNTQDFRKFKDKKALVDWLIETKRIEKRTEALKWMKKYIPLEGKFQSDILDYLNKQPGFFAFKLHSGSYMKGGLPDVWAVKDGKLYAFEVKRPFELGEPTELQLKQIKKLREAGAMAEVVTYVAEVAQLIGGSYGD